MIKNKILLFDLHGVLIDYSFYELFKLFIKYNKKINLIFCFLDPRIIYKSIYLLITENVVEKVAVTLISEFPKLEKHSNFIFTGINQQIIKKESFLLLNSLKENNKIYIFSNIGEKSIQILTAKYPDFFGYFDEIFYTKSCEDYLCKPTKKAFENVIKKFDSQDIIFIDNSSKNIKIAQEFGLKTIKFKSYNQLKNAIHYFPHTT